MILRLTYFLLHQSYAYLLISLNGWKIYNQKNGLTSQAFSSPIAMILRTETTTSKFWNLSKVFISLVLPLGQMLRWQFILIISQEQIYIVRFDYFH